MTKIGKVVLYIHSNAYRQGMVNLAGFGESQEPLYLLWIGIKVALLGMMTSLCAYMVLLMRHDLLWVITGVHYIAAMNFLLVMHTTKFLTTKHLRKAFALIREGLYTYEDEECDEEYIKINEDMTKEVKSKVKLYETVYCLAFPSTMFFSPILAYLFIPEDSPFFTNGVVNPIMPHMFYTPFDTHNAAGFTVAYVWDVVFWILACSTTYSAVFVVTWLIANTTHELRILNHSVRNIQKRAERLYAKRFGARTGAKDIHDLLKKKEFHDCLYTCLRANIRHYEVILKFRELVQPMIGPALFALYSTIAVVLYAALLYLLIQPIPIGLKLRYVSMFLSEESAGWFGSVTGEEVIAEGCRLFEVLYEMPWFHYDRRFKQALLIIMACSRKPLAFDALFVDATASKQAFNKLVTDTYTLMNLIQNTSK